MAIRSKHMPATNGLCHWWPQAAPHLWSDKCDLSESRLGRSCPYFDHVTLPEPSGGAQGRACVGGASLKRALPAMKDIPIRRDGVYRPICDSGGFHHMHPAFKCGFLVWNSEVIGQYSDAKLLCLRSVYSIYFCHIFVNIIYQYNIEWLPSNFRSFGLVEIRPSYGIIYFKRF